MNADESTPTTYARATDAIRRLDLRLAVAVTLACIAAFGVLGYVYNASTSLEGHGYIYKPAGTLLALFDLDAEHVLPALFSGLLLLAAAAVAFLLPRAGLKRVGSRRWWSLMALVFLVMGFDEVAVIHEKLQDATGVKWQLLYLPLFIVAAVAGLTAVAALWRYRPAALVFLAGGGCWLVSQVIEQWQWKHGYLLHPLSIIPEETLEMSGSALFAMAVVLAIRRWAPAAARAPGDADADPAMAALASQS